MRSGHGIVHESGLLKAWRRPRSHPSLCPFPSCSYLFHLSCSLFCLALSFYFFLIPYYLPVASFSSCYCLVGAYPSLLLVSVVTSGGHRPESGLHYFNHVMTGHDHLSFVVSLLSLKTLLWCLAGWGCQRWVTNWQSIHGLTGRHNLVSFFHWLSYRVFKYTELLCTNVYYIEKAEDEHPWSDFSPQQLVGCGQLLFLWEGLCPCHQPPPSLSVGVSISKLSIGLLVWTAECIQWSEWPFPPNYFKGGIYSTIVDAWERNEGVVTGFSQGTVLRWAKCLLRGSALGPHGGQEHRCQQ